MANANIFVFINGDYDRSRWLSISQRGNGTCVLHLTDLCQPGMVSSLGNVVCPIDYIKATLARGAYQVTTSSGYVLIRRTGPLLTIEFKGFADRSGVKASFLASEVLDLLDVMRSEADYVSVR